MGKSLSKKKTQEQLAFEFRRQNDKISNKIQKLISKSYRLGYISEQEYNCTLGYYYGLKSRNALHPDPAFINALDDIHDHMAALIKERLDREAEKEALTLSPSAPPSENSSTTSTDADIKYGVITRKNIANKIVEGTKLYRHERF